MAIILSCPAGHRLKVPNKFLGRRIACPVCDARLEVPERPDQQPAKHPKPTKTQASARPQNKAPATTSAQPPPALPKEPTLPSPLERPVATREDAADKHDDTVAKTPAVDVATHRADALDAGTPNADSLVADSPAAAPLDSNAALYTEPAAEQADAVSPTPAFHSDDEIDLNWIPVDPIDSAMEVATDEEYWDQADPEEYRFAEFAIQELSVPTAHGDLHSTYAGFTQTVVLAMASIAVALLCLVPAIVEQSMARQVGLRAPDGWSYLVILISIIQISMACLALRVPDWSTAWLMTVTATAVGSIYAAGLALTMFAHQSHTFVRQLGLLDESVRGRAQPWCFLVVCLAVLLAYICGRWSVGWRQALSQQVHFG